MYGRGTSREQKGASLRNGMDSPSSLQRASGKDREKGLGRRRGTTDCSSIRFGMAGTREKGRGRGRRRVDLWHVFSVVGKMEWITG